MDSSRQERERARLTELYGNMNDGELERVASEADELTDDARALIQAELARRNISVPEPQLEPVHGEHTPEAEPITSGNYQGMVMVRRFRDLPAAVLAKGALDSAGIENYLTDENMIRLDWFISNLIGGAKLIVKPEDLEAAGEILNQPIPDNFDVEGDENFQQPKCPRCGALDISYEDINKPASYASAWLGVPIPFPRDAWKCNSCGAEWKEIPDGPTETDEVENKQE